MMHKSLKNERMAFSSSSCPSRCFFLCNAYSWHIPCKSHQMENSFQTLNHSKDCKSWLSIWYRAGFIIMTLLSYDAIKSHIFYEIRFKRMFYLFDSFDLRIDDLWNCLQVVPLTTVFFQRHTALTKIIRSHKFIHW